MDFNEYQKKARSTAIYPERHKIIYPSLGLCGESGEVAEKIKKVLRDNYGRFDDNKKKEIAIELGDTLWYMSNLASDLGYTMEEIAEMNINKLQLRMKNGKLKGNGDNR